jgi:hypothetical protein
LPRFKRKFPIERNEISYLFFHQTTIVKGNRIYIKFIYFCVLSFDFFLFFHNQPKKTDAFLTHCWGTDELGRDVHARVLAINFFLSKKMGIVTWFDEEQMKGDVRSKMAEGIDNTQCMIVFVTKNYHDKVNGVSAAGLEDNCRVSFLLLKSISILGFCFYFFFLSLNFNTDFAVLANPK